MIDFKTFLHKSDILKEYLTPKQEKKFASLEMTPHARKNTDHFFGVGNDRKVEDIKNYEHDKSEIHQKVESHLGQKISHDEYKSGIVKDKYGRDAKLGRIIKDNSLRNEFASDPSRSGSKAIKKPYMSVVRGAHVMGQTNPESDAIHPTGHSWKDESCKNVETGINKKFLNQEVKHGSVVVFGHDHDGKEIYRATLQPHHNDLGHVAYSVDGQYGIKHPNFVAHAHDVAKRLTGEHKGGSLVYTKNPNVYDDTGKKDIMHPMATPEHISKALNDKDAKVREMAIQHPNITAEHISKALNDKEGRVREIAIQNPKATPEHISKALNDKSKHMRFAAIKNPNATPEHITKALNDNHSDVRVAAMNHPNATTEHISKALNDKDANVRTMAIYHPKATAEHITTALNDKDKGVRLWAIKHQNATAEHISKALNDKDIGVRLGAVKNPNATAEHITKALNDKEATVRDEAKAARKK